MIDQAYAEKRTDASVRFAQLIEEERTRRLVTIDDEAQAAQQDVEAAEKEYFEGKAAPSHDHAGH